MDRTADNLKLKILQLIREYYALAFPPTEFIAGQTPVPYAGRVFDHDELTSLVEAALDFWLTSGRFAEEFERGFARFMGLRHALLVNSGSSANLLALSCLTSPKLGERQLRPGDEVITVAAAFPTTVNPIVQCRLTPVFLDVTIPAYNVDVSQLEAAFTSSADKVERIAPYHFTEAHISRAILVARLHDAHGAAPRDLGGAVEQHRADRDQRAALQELSNRWTTRLAEHPVEREERRGRIALEPREHAAAAVEQHRALERGVGAQRAERFLGLLTVVERERARAAHREHRIGVERHEVFGNHVARAPGQG